MNDFVKETLEKQMKLLSERSAELPTYSTTTILCSYTEQIINLAKILDPELRSQSCAEAPLPFVGHLSMSDLEALAKVRHEWVRQSIEETQQFYKDLQSQSSQSTQAK